MKKLLSIIFMVFMINTFAFDISIGTIYNHTSKLIYVDDKIQIAPYDKLEYNKRLTKIEFTTEDGNKFIIKKLQNSLYGWAIYTMSSTSTNSLTCVAFQHVPREMFPILISGNSVRIKTIKYSGYYGNLYIDPEYFLQHIISTSVTPDREYDDLFENICKDNI